VIATAQFSLYVELVMARMYGLTMIGNGTALAGTRMHDPNGFVEVCDVEATPVEIELPRNSHDPASADTMIIRVPGLSV
jgi:hypothetical protein